MPHRNGPEFLTPGNPSQLLLHPLSSSPGCRSCHGSERGEVVHLAGASEVLKGAAGTDHFRVESLGTELTQQQPLSLSEPCRIPIQDTNGSSSLRCSEEALY